MSIDSIIQAIRQTGHGIGVFSGGIFLSPASVVSNSLPHGALILSLVDPFAGLGLGTTEFTSFGTVPAQLALSGSSIVAGSGAMIPGQSYAIGIRAQSGDGNQILGETFKVITQTSN